MFEKFIYENEFSDSEEEMDSDSDEDFGHIDESHNEGRHQPLLRGRDEEDMDQSDDDYTSDDTQDVEEDDQQRGGVFLDLTPIGGVGAEVGIGDTDATQPEATDPRIPLYPKSSRPSVGLNMSQSLLPLPQMWTSGEGMNGYHRSEVNTNLQTNGGDVVRDRVRHAAEGQTNRVVNRLEEDSNRDLTDLRLNWIHNRQTRTRSQAYGQMPFVRGQAGQARGQTRAQARGLTRAQASDQTRAEARGETTRRPPQRFEEESDEQFRVRAEFIAQGHQIDWALMEEKLGLNDKLYY